LVTDKAHKEDETGGGYLHRGIARCAFERRLSLADHMKVMGASLDNGLLDVDVVREVPEAAKPRTIKIGTAVETMHPQVTEQKKQPNRQVRHQTALFERLNALEIRVRFVFSLTGRADGRRGQPWRALNRGWAC
jgi:hypothetical protein